MTETEKQNLQLVITDTRIGGVHFHVRFRTDHPDHSHEHEVEYFVNKRRVTCDAYKLVLSTARATAVEDIADALGEDSTIAADLRDLSDHVNAGVGDSFARKLLDVLGAIADR